MLARFFSRRALTNGDPSGGLQQSTTIMALLGALAAAGSGRQGCVLRVAADALSLYCGGGAGSDGGSGGGEGDVTSGSGVGSDAGADDDGDVVAGNYLNASAGRLATGDYFRPVRSVAIGDAGYYYDAGNDSAAASVLANVTANVTASLEPFLNGSYNHTVGAETVENLTNYIFVITIGIILGAMILTTICGKLLARNIYLIIISC